MSERGDHLELPPVEVVDAIPPEALPGVIAQLSALAMRAAARMTTAQREAARTAPEREAPEPAAWLTPEDVARRLRKSPTWVRRAIKRGEFPGARRSGRTWRLPEAALARYWARCPAGGP